VISYLTQAQNTKILTIGINGKSDLKGGRVNQQNAQVSFFHIF
jgi:hypothetical protein